MQEDFESIFVFDSETETRPAPVAMEVAMEAEAEPAVNPVVDPFAEDGDEAGETKEQEPEAKAKPTKRIFTMLAGKVVVETKIDLGKEYDTLEEGGSVPQNLYIPRKVFVLPKRVGTHTMLVKDRESGEKKTVPVFNYAFSAKDPIKETFPVEQQLIDIYTDSKTNKVYSRFDMPDKLEDAEKKVAEEFLHKRYSVDPLLYSIAEKSIVAPVVGRNDYLAFTEANVFAMNWYNHLSLFYEGLASHILGKKDTDEDEREEELKDAERYQRYAQETKSRLDFIIKTSKTSAPKHTKYNVVHSRNYPLLTTGIRGLYATPAEPTGGLDLDGAYLVFEKGMNGTKRTKSRLYAFNDLFYEGTSGEVLEKEQSLFETESVEYKIANPKFAKEPKWFRSALYRYPDSGSSTLSEIRSGIYLPQKFYSTNEIDTNLFPLDISMMYKKDEAVLVWINPTNGELNQIELYQIVRSSVPAGQNLVPSRVDVLNGKLPKDKSWTDTYGAITSVVHENASNFFTTVVRHAIDKYSKYNTYPKNLFEYIVKNPKNYLLLLQFLATLDLSKRQVEREILAEIGLDRFLDTSREIYKRYVQNQYGSALELDEHNTLFKKASMIEYNQNREAILISLPELLKEKYKKIVQDALTPSKAYRVAARRVATTSRIKISEKSSVTALAYKEKSSIGEPTDVIVSTQNQNLSKVFKEGNNYLLQLSSRQVVVSVVAVTDYAIVFGNATIVQILNAVDSESDDPRTYYELVALDRPKFHQDTPGIIVVDTKMSEYSADLVFIPDTLAEKAAEARTVNEYVKLLTDARKEALKDYKTKSELLYAFGTVKSVSVLEAVDNGDDFGKKVRIVSKRKALLDMKVQLPSPEVNVLVPDKDKKAVN